MQLLATLEEIQSLIENGLNIHLEPGDFADGGEEVVHIFLHEACHAAVAHCVPWVLELEEDEHTAVDELLARLLEMEIGEAAGQPVHSPAVLTEELARYPVNIGVEDFKHLRAMWGSYFWPKYDLAGMASYCLTYLRYGQVICHILPRSDWEDALRVGHYAPKSLRLEGFIHCSGIDQVLRTANAYYHDQPDLLLLTIAVSKVAVEICWEDTTGAGENFPHIYGLLNLDAVIRVSPMDKAPTGKFHLPKEQPVLAEITGNLRQVR